MKLIHSNFRRGEAKILVQNLDDLWYLSSILEESDKLKGKTLRKMKKNEQQEAVKKPVFLKIKLDRVEFSKTSPVLRASGTIAEASEDIPLGEHHTFNIEPGTVITIIKENWLNYQIDKLKEACSNKTTSILLCLLDREEAYFAMLKKYGYEILSNIKGDVKKKYSNEEPRTDFYSTLAKQLKEYDMRYNLEKIIVASPAFWKEELMKNLDSELKKKIILATCSDASVTGINEVLKRPEVISALKGERVAAEMVLVEKLLEEISTKGKCAYGLDEAEQTAFVGAVQDLIVTDSFIQKSRIENFYARLENVMKTVERAKGRVTIISSEHEGGKKLDGLGGIGAILRYKISY